MSVAVKAVLATLVLLPPGTFRSLDAWIHRAQSHRHVGGFAITAQRPFIVTAADGADRTQDVNWSDVAFLEDDEDATHARKFRVETARHFQISASDCLTIGIARLRQSVVSLLDAHAGPRGLLLAKRELLL